MIEIPEHVPVAKHSPSFSHSRNLSTKHLKVKIQYCKKKEEVKKILLPEMFIGSSEIFVLAAFDQVHSFTHKPFCGQRKLYGSLISGEKNLVTRVLPPKNQ